VGVFAPLSVRESAEVQGLFMNLPLENIHDDRHDLV
jgi:hypothetical protein